MSRLPKPYDPKENRYDVLTRIEIQIVYKVDSMDSSVEKHEARFLNGIITKIKEQGEENAVFSAKQRNWIHALGDKYLH